MQQFSAVKGMQLFLVFALSAIFSGIVTGLPSNLKEVTVSTRTCFGAKEDRFGVFTLPSGNGVTRSSTIATDPPENPGIPVVAFRLTAVAGSVGNGVTCSASTHARAPLQCKEYYNIGIACGNNSVSPIFTPKNETTNTSSNEGSVPITAQNLHQLIAVNETTATEPNSVWLTSVNTVLPAGTQCAVVYLSDFYDNLGLEQTSAGTSCVSVTAFLAGQVDAGLASQNQIAASIVNASTGDMVPIVVDSSCFDAREEASCQNRAFCGWAPHSSTCCPIRSALNSSTEDPRCTCPRVDPLLRLTTTAVSNPTCNVKDSVFFTRNLIARYCQQTSTSSVAATSAEISLCLAEFRRCIPPPRASSPLRPYARPLASVTFSSVITTTPPSTYSSLVDLALSYQCQSSSWNVCADPTQSCSRVETVVTASPFAFNFTIAPVANDGVASVFVNQKSLKLESIHDGTAELTFSLHSINWNQTLFEDDIEAVRDAFTPLTTGTKFGWSREVIQPNRSYFKTPTDVVIRLGPHPSFRPETLSYEIQFQPTVNMFEASGNIGGATSVTFTVEREPLDWRLTNFTNIVSVATAYGTLLSGASGWIGLATLQTNMMMAHTDCAELNFKLMFPNAKFIVTPWRYVEDSHRLVFLVGLGLVLFFILCHLAAVGLYKVITRPRILAEAFRATWNPYMVLYTCPVTLVGMTQTAWTGMIDDQTAYIRVLFGLTDGVYFVLLLFAWDYCRRKGFEGYYALYSNATRLDGDDGPSSRSPHRKESSSHNAAKEIDPTIDAKHDENKHHQEDARKAAVNAGQNVFKARWHEIRMAYATGQLRAFCQAGVLHWFKPRGHWPNARGFTALREQCHETGCAFPIVVLLFLFLAGANASHFSNEKNFCYAIYWNYTVLSLVYFALFAFFTPFRTPILNLLWAISHILELATYATSARWVIVDDPSQHDGSRIAPLALSALLVQAALNLHVFLTTFVERFIYLSQWCKTYGDADAAAHDGGFQNDSLRGDIPQNEQAIRTGVPIHQAMAEAEAASVRARGGTGLYGAPTRFRPPVTNGAQHSSSGKHSATVASEANFISPMAHATSGLRHRQSSLSPVLVASQVVDEDDNYSQYSHHRSILAPLSTVRDPSPQPLPSPYSHVGEPRRILREQLEAAYSPDRESAAAFRKQSEASTSRSLSPRYNPLVNSVENEAPTVPLKDSGFSNIIKPKGSRNLSYKGPTTVLLGPLSSPAPGSEQALRSPELGSGHLLSMVRMFGATRVRAPKPKLQLDQVSSIASISSDLKHLDEDTLSPDQRRERAAAEALQEEEFEESMNAVDETVELTIDFRTFEGAMEAVHSLNNRVFYGRQVNCTVVGPQQAVNQFRQALL